MASAPDSSSTPPATPSATIDGTVERFLYQNEDSAWGVLRVAVAGRKQPVTVVGNLLGVQPGESLRMRGAWVNDKRFGEQFRVESYLPLKPSTVGGIEKYLGSGLVQGIGSAMAARLVEKFGVDTLDVIENQPERLKEVEGIGPVRSKRIREAFVEQRDIREVMVFLQSHNVSAFHAVRIFEKFGKRAIAVVRENPYRLAMEIRGIGFKTADAIAANLGIPKDSPRRAEAGVLHVMRELSEEGHCYQTREALLERATTVLDIDLAIVDAAVRALLLSRHLVAEGDPAAPSTHAIYLHDLHRAEAGAAARVRSILDTPAPPVSIDIPRAISWFEQQQSITLAPQQRAAVERALQPSCKILVITGGPGTGKTTIINAIIKVLEKKNRRILLCAPTGRAAKRMRETTGRESRTAHRLLEYSPQRKESPGDSRFARNREHPLECDMLIVDEVSMVDIVLFHNILDALPDAAQLVLVGDVDQLPSVGPGSVLRDVIRSNAADVARLTEIFRQAEESLIIVNAHRINRGQEPKLDTTDKSDFFCIERDTPEEVLATIKDLVAQRIPRRFSLDPVDEIQVLTPMHRGLLGGHNLNLELQALLNLGPGPALTRGARSFRAGDKVMQIRNNYDLDVYNGDIGRVSRIDDEERSMIVRFDEREVTYGYSDIDELVLAYACSIHKSQGSEYPCVVIPLHTQHYLMLQRNLLYTAVTRGKRLVVLVGSRKAIGIAVKNQQLDVRATRLAERLATGT